MRRRAETTEFFRETAPQWDEVRDELLGPPHHLDRLVEWADASGTAVDLGTGTGVLLGRLAATASRVIGVDASPEMLEEAERRVAADGTPHTDLRIGALGTLMTDMAGTTTVATGATTSAPTPAAAVSVGDANQGRRATA